MSNDYNRSTQKLMNYWRKLPKDDIVEINLPDELGMNEADAYLLEAIHSIYAADRIENKLYCSLHAYILFIDLRNFVLII